MNQPWIAQNPSQLTLLPMSSATHMVLALYRKQPYSLLKQMIS
jgi:hypothetical protein